MKTSTFALMLLMAGVSTAANANLEYGFVLHQDSAQHAGCSGGAMRGSCVGPFNHDYTATGPDLKTIRVCGAEFMAVSTNGDFPLEGECIEFLNSKGQVVAQFPGVKAE